MSSNELTYKIRGAAFAVYRTLGPGLLEKVYQEAMAYQLTKDGLSVQCEVPVPVIYDGHVLSTEMRLDLLVEDTVIVELKSVEMLLPVHKKQLQTYLKLSNRHVGLLINFNVPTMDGSAIVRCINGVVE
ncbi:MAG: GxxExxY protein [Bacteroidales bacterium]|nr:GxxExxY protein [Candidatus Colicola caccequi]